MSVLILPNGDAVRADQISLICTVMDQGGRVIRVELLGGRWIKIPCEDCSPSVRDELITQWREALKEP